MPGKTLDDMDGIAATAGPGLIGSLLVGLTYAKALAFSKKKPLAAVIETNLLAHLREALVPFRRDGKLRDVSIASSSASHWEKPNTCSFPRISQRCGPLPGLASRAC